MRLTNTVVFSRASDQEEKTTALPFPYLVVSIGWQKTDFDPMMCDALRRRYADR